MKINVLKQLDGVVAIYITDKQKDINYIAEACMLKLHKYIPGEQLRPTLVFDIPEATQLKDALQRELGTVETEQDAKVKGTLIATRYHLEDMRNLVFKKENK